MKRRLQTAILALASVVALGGCQNAHFFHRSARATPLAVNLTPVGPYAAEDRLYDRAVKALEVRDYGEALDILQMAREARADDPRVLTAMGVVYDKLGRFDLSARYYDLAEKADPGSKVVAIDRAYSQLLQRTGSNAADSVVVVSRQNATVMALSLAGPEPMDFKQATLISKVIKAGVRVRNATGLTLGADPIKGRLAAAGWTLTRAPPLEPRKAAVSTVAYPSGVLRVAKALARSLPYPVTLRPCAQCVQLQVVVGSDALRSPNLPSMTQEARRG